ncbi:MAG TPA: hypothetical protein VNW92_19930, partial [Polyangiaceae bacterium]|nr:hypothetical protein [Polyangiaceae bacterium]
MTGPEASSPIVQGAPEPVLEQQKPRGNAFLNWFFLRDQLAQARKQAAQLNAEQREHVRRAKLAFELGELALAPGNAVQSGSTAPLAANLFRQSIYWALRSQQEEGAPLNPEAVWALAGPNAVATLAADEAQLSQLSTAMRSTFIELADGSPEAQRTTADQLRRVAKRLVMDAQRVLWQLEWIKLRRLVHVLVLGIVCLAVIVLAAISLPPKTDLAKGKPWRVSSVGMECHPEKSDCGGTTTDILFHTKVEQNPWFEYDFGSPLAFSSLTIRNRSDFGPERAVPLVVEVSNDDKKFQEIARRTDSFAT